jgi:hypothetical protein
LVAERFLLGAELVLVEGYKHANIDKIEVVAPGREPMLPSGGRLLALARRGGRGQEAGLPVLDADDPRAVAEFVLAHTREVRSSGEVRMWIGERAVELSPEAGRLLAQTLVALAREIPGVEVERGIRVEVQ